MDAKNVAVALKMLYEIVYLRKVMKENIDWIQLEKYFINSAHIDNNMMFLTNLSYMEPFVS